MITIGLSKGRLLKESSVIIEALGSTFSSIAETRKLVIDDEAHQIRYILLKPSDVPTYVEQGIVDVGIVGKDTLIENPKNVYELLNLPIGKCRFSVAGLPESAHMMAEKRLRVATKYPNIATEFFKGRHTIIEIIKLNGSVELAPLVGLSDVIVDLVETGSTLKANGLVVYEDILKVSARLIVNKVSYRHKQSGIQRIVEKIIDQVKMEGCNND